MSDTNIGFWHDVYYYEDVMLEDPGETWLKLLLANSIPIDADEKCLIITRRRTTA